MGSIRNFFKIGYSGRDIDTRQSEMEFECDRERRIVYDRKVPNAERVEASCHADLSSIGSRSLRSGDDRQLIEAQFKKDPISKSM